MVEVGAVAPEVLSGVQAMRQRSVELLNELGRMELTKANVINELRRLENQSQTLLRQEADRLGIPEGTPWQLTPDGKAMAPPLSEG
jgi:hypothetical protein